MKVTITYDEIYYKVEYQINELSVDFTAWKLTGYIPEVKEPEIWGRLKWDGCADFNTQGDGHYCGIFHVEQYLQLWKELYSFIEKLGETPLNKETK